MSMVRQRQSGPDTAKPSNGTRRPGAGPLWTRYAHVYDRLVRHFPLYDELTGRLCHLMQTHVDQGGRILDAGCGTGLLASRLSASFRVTAADATPAMLEQARRRSRTEGGDPCFTLMRLDLSHPLPFRDARFDAIACVHVLYALPAPDDVLREFRRVLRPGGLLLSANMTSRISLARTVREILGHYGLWRGGRIVSSLVAVGYYNLLLSRYQAKGVMHYWSVAEYRTLLARCGFRLCASELGYVAKSDLISLSTVSAAPPR